MSQVGPPKILGLFKISFVLKMPQQSVATFILLEYKHHENKDHWFTDTSQKPKMGHST